MNVKTRPAILDIAPIREDFPILRQKIRGKDLAFHSAASAQKPRVVIEARKEAGDARLDDGSHDGSTRCVRRWRRSTPTCIAVCTG